MFFLYIGYFEVGLFFDVTVTSLNVISLLACIYSWNLLCILDMSFFVFVFCFCFLFLFLFCFVYKPQTVKFRCLELFWWSFNFNLCFFFLYIGYFEVGHVFDFTVTSLNVWRSAYLGVYRMRRPVVILWYYLHS